MVFEFKNIRIICYQLQLYYYLDTAVVQFCFVINVATAPKYGCTLFPLYPWNDVVNEQLLNDKMAITSFC